MTTQSQTLNVGVVGLGLAAASVASAMVAMPHVNLVAGAGIYIYGDEGTTEVPLPEARGAYAPELDELYDALIDGKPALHSGLWGLATLEVCLALMQSATGTQGHSDAAPGGHP